MVYKMMNISCHRKVVYQWILAAVLGLGLCVGILCVPAGDASLLVRLCGYGVLAITFVLWLYSVVQVLREALLSPRGVRLRDTVHFIAAIGVGAYVILSHAHFDYKIVGDEYVISATAKHMHETREVAYSTLVVHDGSRVQSLHSAVDKRPWLYPFLVACMHDLFGFSAPNAFVLNVICLLLFLAAIYCFGYFLFRIVGGWLAVLLWASLPLLAQNATGAGMELVNLLGIQLLILVAVLYLRSPSRWGQSCLWLSCALLACARYESILFLAPVAFVVAFGWYRQRTVDFTWSVLWALPLFALVFLQNKIYSVTESSWELAKGATQPFSISNAIGNAPHALYFFFAHDPAIANSLLISILGGGAIISLVVMAGRWIRSKAWQQPECIVLLAFGSFLIIHFVVILAFHASQLDRPFVARYALPFHILLVAAIISAIRLVTRERPGVARFVCCLTIGFIVTFTFPANAREVFSTRSFIVREKNWLFATYSGMATDRNLIVDFYSQKWTLYEQPAITPGQALEVLQNDTSVFDFKKFSSVYLVVRCRFSGGDYQPTQRETMQLLERLDVELLAERSFRPLELTRFYRIVD
ncbi:MAG TPA: hypothetical protein DEA90_02145 [Opitutae bacterium]|nr:hypothetical protein [Opitutae bacterium]